MLSQQFVRVVYIEDYRHGDVAHAGCLVQDVCAETNACILEWFNPPALDHVEHAFVPASAEEPAGVVRVPGVAVFGINCSV